jgi:hypothetical protein
LASSRPQNNHELTGLWFTDHHGQVAETFGRGHIAVGFVKAIRSPSMVHAIGIAVA